MAKRKELEKLIKNYSEENVEAIEKLEELDVAYAVSRFTNVSELIERCEFRSWVQRIWVDLKTRNVWDKFDKFLQEENYLRGCNGGSRGQRDHVTFHNTIIMLDDRTAVEITFEEIYAYGSKEPSEYEFSIWAYIGKEPLKLDVKRFAVGIIDPGKDNYEAFTIYPDNTEGYEAFDGQLVTSAIGTVNLADFIQKVDEEDYCFRESEITKQLKQN